MLKNKYVINENHKLRYKYNIHNSFFNCQTLLNIHSLALRVKVCLVFVMFSKFENRWTNIKVFLI